MLKICKILFDDFEYMKNHIVTHAIILNDKNHVLITKRASNLKIYPDLWSIPGGHKTNESFKNCLKREIEEELGAQIIKVIKSIPVYEEDVDNKHWIIKLSIIKINNKIKPNKEIADYKWINPKDVYKFKTTPILDKHFKRAGIL